MTFSTIVDRIRYDFIEMPGMELTMAQAVRLWNLGTDDCRHVLDTLVDHGFLRWTPRRTIIRTGKSLTPSDGIASPLSFRARRQEVQSA